MTTIAYKDGILAADTQMTIDESIKITCSKILRLTPEIVMAEVGETLDCNIALKYFSDPNWPSIPLPEVSKDFETIIIIKGIPYFCEGNLIPIKLTHPFWAAGSGWKFAYAAMHRGDDAITAVKFASELDIFTNNVVEHFNVNEHFQTKKQSKRK